MVEDRQIDEDFEQFAYSATPKLMRVALRLTGERFTAEDLVQDALIRVGLAWGSIERREGVDGPYGYALVTLLNAFRSLRRRAWRRREVSVSRVSDSPEQPRPDPCRRRLKTGR
jgi:DNA-directed RNA polymerase specialized sigma24 family protein